MVHCCVPNREIVVCSAPTAVWSVLRFNSRSRAAAHQRNERSDNRTRTVMNPTSRDILTSRSLTVAVFCLPVAAIVLAGNVEIGNHGRAAVWTVCLGVMATGCLLNARRCGRVHCYFTGPFFILMAIVSLTYGLGWLLLGASGWNWIGAVTIGGAILLGCVPEFLFGKYRRR